MATTRVFRLPSNTQLNSYLTQASASTTYATKVYPEIQSSAKNNTRLGTRALNRASELNIPEDSTALGYEALRESLLNTQNTAVGRGALQSITGSNNIGVGRYAGAFMGSGSNNVYIGGNTGNGAFQFNASNNIVISDGEGNIRIRSNGSGQIQMPNQTAFCVYALGASTQTGNLTYNATVSNNLGSMNLATGLFTANVPGHYHFNYYGFVDQGLGGNTTISFQKNGVYSPSRSYNDFNDTSYGPVISISSIISLAANDNVRVNITGAGMHGNDNSFFSGFLIG
jgi:hypothetical protein